MVPFPIWMEPVPPAMLPIVRPLIGRIESTRKDPRIVVDAFADPRLRVPAVKLAPTVIADKADDAFMTLTAAVEMFNAETLIEDRVCVPLQI